MEENTYYLMYESATARAEVREKRQWKVIVLLILLLVVSNLCWLYNWCQYDYVGTTTETTYTQDGQGVNIIGDSNDVTEQEGKNGN